MDQHDSVQHLSQIMTVWTMVRRAHQNPGEAAREAQKHLLDRYSGAVRRYLRGLLRDEDAAADVFQEFACEVLGGDLGGADPRRGRFRNFIKGVLFHLVAKYHARRVRQPGPLPDGHPGPTAEEPGPADHDQAFLASWRDDLLARAWAGLAEDDRQSGRAFYAVLRCRADHPDWSSSRLADEMGSRCGRPLTSAALRQALHRAREKFADLLLDEVAHSIEDPTPGALEEELADLELLEYCRPALLRRAGEPA
jgi:DNA-directed RNA polymerase specialized sigma24 family protein